MKNQNWIHLFLVIGFVLIFGYSNCSQPPVQYKIINQNTIAGNPFSGTTQKLVSELCSVITRCHPNVTEQSCFSGVSTTSGFHSIFGLPESYSTPNSLEAAENAGLIAGKAPQAQSCFQNLQNLNCSDAVVQLSYNNASSTPFAGAVQMLSGSACEQTFTTPARYVCDSKVFLTNQTNAPLNLAMASPLATYSIAPPLPAGLQLNSLTGVISGTPTVNSPMTSYTLTALLPSGSINSTLQIRSAAGYAVNDLSDSANVGGSVCQTAQGTCSLRAALSANQSAGSLNVILLPSGVIRLTSNSPLVISSPVDLYGDCENKTTLDGNNSTQILSVRAGPTNLENLIVQNGVDTNSAGVGILITASTAGFTTNLNNIVIQNNTNTGGASGMAAGAGLAAFGQAGAVATVNLSRCVVSGNRNINGNFGGGIGFWSNTHLNMSDCTISNNQSTSYGGGLSSHSGSLNIQRSLFANNTSGGVGGGLFVDQTAGFNSTLTNVTFASNTAQAGGAIYLGAQSMTINNSTFVDNQASNPIYAGALSGMGNQIRLQNSLFSNNLSNGTLAHCRGNGNAMVLSLGNNLSDSTANDCNLQNQTDLVNQSPALGPLQNNGGLTSTFALLMTSPARNQGNLNTCSAVDQRGQSRLTIDNRCDIGAFEF